MEGREPILDRLMGIETEYGLAVEGVGADGLGAESLAVVRAYPGVSVGNWDYQRETPRHDLRGFTVKDLKRDPHDKQFSRPGDSTGSGAADHGDRVLANGARLYNDHGHPEYSTPECRSLVDLVAHDRAGEHIVLTGARARSEQAGRRVDVYKNNTDYHGASYGCHESYLTRRPVDPADLIAGLAPFLATRQVFAGAGKVGLEDDGGQKPGFQISQRADFVAVEASVDTLHRRPLVNTRDEPHAASAQYLRLHVIVGDANRSEWATAMKSGTTSLVLGLLETGWRGAPHLLDAPKACRQVSRSSSPRCAVNLSDHRSIVATDIQRLYLAGAEKQFTGHSDQTDWVLSEWQRVLDDLETGHEAASDRVDWAAKLVLLDDVRAETGLDWGDSLLQSIDLTYHNVDPTQGLSHALEQDGRLVRLVSDGAISSASTCAPGDTRAAVRGHCVDRYADAISSIGWSGVAFECDGQRCVVEMDRLVDNRTDGLADRLAACCCLTEVVALVRSLNGAGADTDGEV